MPACIKWMQDDKDKPYEAWSKDKVKSYEAWSQDKVKY